MDEPDIAETIRAAAPAIAIHSDFLPAHLSIRFHCGTRAAALEARLTVLQAECEMAALEVGMRGSELSAQTRQISGKPAIPAAFGVDLAVLQSGQEIAEIAGKSPQESAGFGPAAAQPVAPMRVAGGAARG